MAKLSNRVLISLWAVPTPIPEFCVNADDQSWIAESARRALTSSPFPSHTIKTSRDGVVHFRKLAQAVDKNSLFSNF